MAPLWLYLLAVLGSTHAARILGIFPSPSISHQLPFQAVMKALADRGHQVTVISTDPLKTPHSNYTDIDLSFTYKLIESIKDDMELEMGNTSPYKMITTSSVFNGIVCEAQLSSEIMQNFMKSEQKFDLVFIEAMPYSCTGGLMHKVGSPPAIGILSFGGFTQTYEAMGSPFNPAVDLDIWWPYDKHMSFFERANNFVYWLWSTYQMVANIAPAMEKISKKYYGGDMPSVWDMERNYSLIMLNNHWTMSYPRPLVPGIIELGSLQVQTKTKPLPKDIKDFLDGATEGFIYFSLGSNVRSDKLPENKRNEFLAAFAELPQRVLWKWESDSMPGQPKNVMLSKWLPQQDVLAHPNIRVFITQGGLQSLNEATQHVVPLVGIPFMGDQPYNVKKIVTTGVGLKIDFATATKDTILETLKAVINEPSYRENMKKLSSINKDQPETPLERAVWWTEYVLRHNGAKHLRSAALDLAWYQYLLLDVVAFLLASLLISSLMCWIVIRKTIRCVTYMSGSKSKKE